MISCGPLPLISPWLYRLGVRKIARRVTSGEVPAVRELAAVFCTSSDINAREIAGQELRLLKNKEQIDLLCHESLLWDNDGLRTLATGCGYLPAAPAERALFIFCISCPGEIPQPDPENHLPLLAAGYAGSSAPIRARTRTAARANGTCCLLARALSGPCVTHHAGSWTYDEWDIVIAGLISGQRWDDLWLLADLAPITLAVTAISALKGAGWTPAGDDLLLWNGIVSTLPDRWMYPEPAGQAPAPAMKAAGPVVRLCFSPDGSLFATGCRDGMIAVRRTTSAGPVAELSTGPDSVRFLAISADSTCLVYGRENGTVHGHSLQDNTRLWSWEGLHAATAFALSPGSCSVFIGDEGGSLHVLDARDGRVLYSIPLHPSPVTCLAHTPGDSPVACGHTDGTVSVINYRDNSSPRLFSANGSPGRSLTFSPSGTELLALHTRGHPALLDIATGKRTRVFTGHAGRAVCSAVSAESGWFAIGSDDHTLRCWNWREPAPATVIPLYSRHITCCSAVPDGSLLATGFHDGTVRIFRMPGADLLQECQGDKKPITTCTITPDGTRLATVSWGGTSRLWRLPKGEIVRTLDAHAGGIAALAGPAGTLIATATDDGIARILDGSDGTLISTIDLYTPSVRAVAMSPDGMYLASAGADASLRIWTIRDGSLAAAGDPLATSQRCCTFLPNGLSLITGGWDGACRFFRVPDTKLLRTLYGHTSVVSCCTVSRDGTLLVTGSNDTTVRLWKTADEEAYAVLGESRSEVSAVALSPDETLLATGSADGMVRLYRLPYGTFAGELPGLPWKMTALAFTRDGCILIAGFERGICVLLSLPGKALIRTIHAHTGPVTGIAALPDGRTLVTTGGDGVCRFHSLPVTPFLVHAGLADIPVAASEEQLTGGSSGRVQWAFLRTMLSARFRGEIEVCPPLDLAGCYDIQIVG
jgi:WD40 repeat protein